MTRSAPASHALARTGALFLAAEFFAVVALFVGLSVATGDPATSCRWCGTNAFDTAVRGALLARDARAAAAWSHTLSMAAAPALALGAVIVPAALAGRGRHGAQNVAIVLNVFLLVTALADGVKKLADRTRPGVHFGRVAEIEASAAPLEHHLSFFSGDTAWAFALAASAATLAHLRGYPHARRVAQVGAALGALTGALRVAADMHWATDVITGGAVGTAVGVGLPLLLHARRGARDLGAASFEA